MSEENTSLTVQSQSAEPIFQRSGLPGALHGNVGAIQIEQERAIAEAQGKLILAKRFPRNFHKCRADFLEACASLEFAQEAFYTVPNRGHGPSIRFAEEVARCYGNFDYGHRELSRSEGKSEIEVYAWDMELNNYSRRQITVMHVRDKRDGGAQPLKDQTDIDNRIANVASKQMRGRILALVSKALVEEGKAACKRTLAGEGKDKTIAQRVAAMVSSFGRFGVTVEHLETYLAHKLDTVTDDELVDMVGIYNAIREGAKPSDYFAAEDVQSEAATKTAAAITAAAAGPEGKTETSRRRVAATQKPAASEAPAASEETKAAEPAADAPKAETAKPAPAAAATAPAATTAPASEQGRIF